LTADTCIWIASQVTEGAAGKERNARFLPATSSLDLSQRRRLPSPPRQTAGVLPNSAANQRVKAL